MVEAPSKVETEVAEAVGEGKAPQAPSKHRLRKMLSKNRHLSVPPVSHVPHGILVEVILVLC